MLVPVIMAGGSGTRLWPLSRQLFPKQFLPLVEESTMLQATINRLDGLPVENSIAICNEEHRFIVAEQLRRTGELGSIILEPMGKNTAPAVALAALVAQQSGIDPVLLVLAADHVIEDEDAFQIAITNAIEFAQYGKLVTFGIVPTAAHTGYGYIKQGVSTENNAFIVDSFVEKPDLATAEQYVSSAQYLWNSGMFLFKASRYLEVLERFRPDILAACQKSIANLEPDLDFVRVDPVEFVNCPDESIDYAVMEPLCDAAGDEVVVMPLDAGWSDIGSWSSLWQMAEKDRDGNHLSGDVIAHNTNNCYVRAQNRLVATLGNNLTEREVAALLDQRDVDQIRGDQPTWQPVLLAAQEEWLPTLAQEISLRRAGRPVAFREHEDYADLDVDEDLGWLADFDFTIKYLPSGHGDVFLRRLLETTARVSQDGGAASDLFAALAEPRASGRCAKCHTLDDATGAEPGQSLWAEGRITPAALPFTTFDHAPHLVRECSLCHVAEPEGGFEAVAKPVCTTCHTSGMATETCLNCHRYHKERFQMGAGHQTLVGSNEVAGRAPIP